MPPAPHGAHITWRPPYPLVTSSLRDQARATNGAAKPAPKTPPKDPTVTSTPHRSRDAALIAIFAGVIAALGIVPAITVPVVAVPITAQTLGVMLAGSVLGARRGFFAVLLFDALVVLGLPLLSGGRGGIGVFATPSVGFIVGFPIAAFVVGWLVERFGTPYRLLPGIIACLVGGVLVLYIAGILGISLVTRTDPWHAFLGSMAFLPGDVLKAVLAAVIARGVHQAIPGLLGATKAAKAVPVG
ncbi:MAG: biotin transporter BioY [Phycicoccus sp.]|nr:biotin transporter BioY [Phycicoccus sp.]